MNIRTLLIATSAFIISHKAYAASELHEIEDAAHAAAHAIEGAVHTDHGQSSGLPQFDITTFPSQIFWLAVTFAALYLIFAFRVLPDISSVLVRRKDTIESNLEQAEKLKSEAEAVQQQYEKGLEQAQAEAADILKQAEANARASMDKKLNAFQKKAEKEMQASIERIEASKQAVFSDINDIAADVVQISVERIIGVKVTKKEALSAIHPLTEQTAKAA